MKWGLPYEIQRFLPKPTGDAEEAPNEVFDTMCSTSVSNVPACRSPITQHCSPMTRHHVYLSLTCPGPSLGMRLNHFPPGHTWAVPVMWWLSAHNAVVRQGKQARLWEKKYCPNTKGNLWIILLPRIAPRSYPCCHAKTWQPAHLHCLTEAEEGLTTWPCWHSLQAPAAAAAATTSMQHHTDTERCCSARWHMGTDPCLPCLLRVDFHLSFLGFALVLRGFMDC